MKQYAERIREIPKIEYVAQWNLHCQNHKEPLVMRLIKEDDNYISVFKCDVCNIEIAVTLSAMWSFNEQIY